MRTCMCVSLCACVCTHSGIGISLKEYALITYTRGAREVSAIPMHIHSSPKAIIVKSREK
jgi:hypothetical protein